MASVLIVQALIFADGGILALGTNVWNLGFYPCIVGWWIYRIAVGRNPTYARLSVAAMLGILISLEMGALSVAIQTVLSGKSELPLGKFSILMLGVHSPIAVVEGFVTLGVVSFAHRIRPQVVEASLGIGQAFGQSKRSYKPLVGAVFAVTLLLGGVVAWFASAHPDGLEWSIHKIVGPEGIPEASDTLSGRLSRIQGEKALLPDYELPAARPGKKGLAGRGKDPTEPPPWPHASPGKSLSGIVGSLVVLACVCCTALVLVRLRGKGTQTPRGEHPE
jgi:cobalt/nickel transport system permease protein